MVCTQLQHQCLTMDGYYVDWSTGVGANPLMTLLEVIWPQVQPCHIRMQPMSGAMTNHVMRCDLLQPVSPLDMNNQLSPPGLVPSSVIVRVLGSAGDCLGINTQFELFCCKAAAEWGIGARLLLTFGNGRIEECLSAHRTLTAPDLRVPHISSAIARGMAIFHHQMTQSLHKQLSACSPCSQPTAAPPVEPLSSDTQPSLPTNNAPPSDASAATASSSLWTELDLWHRMRGWAAQAQDMTLDTSSYEGSPEAGSIQRLLADAHKLMEQVAWLHQVLTGSSQWASWSVLGHNDLQYGNLMMKHSIQEAQADAAAQHVIDMRLIDYDYACWSQASFDIANHWCEWAADYASQSPDVLDFNQFPDTHQQAAFINTYLHQALAQQQQGSASPAPTTSTYTQVQPTGVAAETLVAAHQGSPHEPGYITQLRQLVGQHAVVTNDGKQGQHVGSVGHTVPANVQQWAQLVLCQSYPDSVQQAEVTCTAQLQGCRAPVSASMLQLLGTRLQASSLAWTAASHLHWALWGVVQHASSTIQFDYLSYAAQRYEQYLLVKPILMQQPSVTPAHTYAVCV